MKEKMRRQTNNNILRKAGAILLILLMCFCFMPNLRMANYEVNAATKYITRTQVQKAITNSFGMKYKATTSYFKVGSKKNAKVTKQEAAKAICLATDLDKASKVKKTIKDKSKIGSSYKGYVYAAVNAGILTLSKGKVSPKAYLTKTQFNNLWKKAVGTKVTSNKTGKTYTNLVLAKGKATLKNVKVKKNLIIAEGAGNGKATLNNVNVGAKILVRGGVVDTVNTKADTFTVKKATTVNLVGANIKRLEVDAKAIINIDKTSIVDKIVIGNKEATINRQEEDPTQTDEEETEENPIIIVKTYSIAITQTTGGTVTTKLSEVKAGTEVTLTVTPDKGYIFDSWQCGVNIVDNKFIMPAKNVLIKAKFMQVEDEEGNPVLPNI